MKKCFCGVLFLLWLVFSATGYAVPRIAGQIVDAESQKPIDFADIFLYAKGEPDPAFYGSPDAQGRFVIDGIKDGEYTLIVRLVGYDIFS